MKRAGRLVLLIDDSTDDIRLTEEALRDANPSARLRVVTDGVEAMAFLRREGVHVDAPRPDLVLLDLNLPGMDGREVLAQIKADPSLQTIPTCILTTSQDAADIAKGYKLQANCYLAKPPQFDQFVTLLRSTCDFWLTRATLPRAGA